MSDGDGGHLGDTAVVDKYRGDVAALVTDAVSAHARVLLVGQPVHADTIPGNEIVAGLNRWARIDPRSPSNCSALEK